MFCNNTYSYMDESTIHPLLKCKLCLKPFVDPVTVNNADRFCRLCATQRSIQKTAIKNDESNTNDNQQLSTTEHLTPVTETLVLQMLDSLLVRCTQCNETNISRGQLNEHKTKACSQETVLCSAADLKCSWIGTREALNEHMERCVLEPLRPALGEIFNEHDQLKIRVKRLEERFNELMN